MTLRELLDLANGVKTSGLSEDMLAGNISQTLNSYIIEAGLGSKLEVSGNKETLALCALDPADRDIFDRPGPRIVVRLPFKAQRYLSYRIEDSYGDKDYYAYEFKCWGELETEYLDTELSDIAEKEACIIQDCTSRRIQRDYELISHHSTLYANLSEGLKELNSLAPDTRDALAYLINKALNELAGGPMTIPKQYRLK